MSHFIPGLTNDIVFKFVFGSAGSEEPLRALLNALLERGPEERIRQVEILNPGLGRDHADDKRIMLDVRARDDRRGMYNIEMQVARRPYIEKRATFYLTRVHSGQIGDGQDYELIAPSMAIWLLDHVRFRERSDLHSIYVLRERGYGDVLTDDLQIHFVELPKFGKHDVNELGTPGDKWLHLLRFAQEYAQGGGPLPEKLRTEEGVAMAFDKMQRAQSDEEVRAWMLSREMFERDVASDLALARREGREEGRQEGRQEGREEGRLEGREEALEEGQLKTARRMLSEGCDVSFIARVTDLTVAQVEALRTPE